MVSVDVAVEVGCVDPWVVTVTVVGTGVSRVVVTFCVEVKVMVNVWVADAWFGPAGAR